MQALLYLYLQIYYLISDQLQQTILFKQEYQPTGCLKEAISAKRVSRHAPDTDAF
jgi:hypothetical protein